MRLLVLILTAVALVGCGQGDDRASVRSVTDRFLAALRAGDGQAACALLSAAARSELVAQEQTPCPEAVTGLPLHGGAVVRTDVDVVAAKVDLDSGASAFLSETRAGWRLSALGCRPAGDPRRVPFDCELSA